MKKRIKTVGFISALSLVGFLVSIGSIAPNKEPKVEIVEASFHKSYSDIKELKKDSDIIVKGVVTNKLKSYAIERNWNLPFTPFEVKPSKVYKGPNVDTLLVSQPGGLNSADNKSIVVKGVNFLEENKEYLLFLKSDQSGKYYITGAIEGKFEIEKDNAKNDKPQFNKKLDQIEKEI